ncbi:MAG: type II secretion system major pseudopilin GspG [Campylobacterota bacterium]
MIEEKNSLKRRGFKKAFSLIELMVVIVILSLLAAFVLPNLTGKGEDAKNSITCVQLKSISQTLKMYKIDNSSYPSTTQGLDVLSKQNYFEDGKLPKDPWGSNYIYTNNSGDIEIISLGANKKEGGGDDIYLSKCGDK